MLDKQEFHTVFLSSPALQAGIVLTQRLQLSESYPTLLRNPALMCPTKVDQCKKPNKIRISVSDSRLGIWYFATYDALFPPLDAYILQLVKILFVLAFKEG